MANTRSAIPKTPVRSRPANAADDVAHVPVKDITGTFRKDELFSFSGRTKYADGKLFIARFTGTITTHENEEFAKILTAETVPEKWLQVVFQALLQLTTGDANSTIMEYENDGIAALEAIKRQVFRLGAANAVPDVKRRIASHRFPTNRHPAKTISEFRNDQRELAALLPSYDAALQISDFKLAAPKEYFAAIAIAGEDADIFTLTQKVIDYYESHLRHHNSEDENPRGNNQFGFRRQNGNRNHPSNDRGHNNNGDGNYNRNRRGNPRAAGINAGGRGGNGGGRGGRGGRNNDNHQRDQNGQRRDQYGDRRPDKPCMICNKLDHFTFKCPEREAVNAQFAGRRQNIVAGVRTHNDTNAHNHHEDPPPGAGGIRVPSNIEDFGFITCAFLAVTPFCENGLVNRDDPCRQTTQAAYESDVDTQPSLLSDDDGSDTNDPPGLLSSDDESESYDDLDYFNSADAILSNAIHGNSSNQISLDENSSISIEIPAVPIFATPTAAAVRASQMSTRGQTVVSRKFNIDSCADIHVCNDAAWFISLRECRLPTSGVSNTTTYASGVGTIVFSPTNDQGITVPITLENVYFVPDQPHNLLSYARLEDAGFQLRLDLRRARHGRNYFTFTRSGGVYPWTEISSSAAVRPSVPRDRADWQLLFSVFSIITAAFTPSDLPRDHWRELFRKPGNEICSEGFSVTDNAFNHSWAGRDNYGNPVYEEQFISRTLDKALVDFATNTTQTRFLLVLPEWKTATWWPQTKHFETVQRFEPGTMLFSCAPTGSVAKLQPANDDASPGRYLADGIPWPVVVLYKDKDTTTSADDNMLFHLRLGHPGERATQVLATHHATGMNGLTKNVHLGCKHCAICHAAKAQRNPARASTAPLDAYAIFELVFSDIFGPLPPAYDGSQYIIHFTDSSTRFTVTHNMHHRDQAGECFQRFLDHVTKIGYYPKKVVVRTDNDTVYVNTAFEAVCDAHGVAQEFTAPYKHTNAAVAERLWKTLLAIMRALLFASTFTSLQWTLAARHATYLYNRRPHQTLEMLTPYEALLHRKPDLTHLRVFGCEAHALIDEGRRGGKLASRVTHGLYVGRDDNSNADLVFDPTTMKVIRSADVKFSEKLDAYGRAVINHSAINVVALEATVERTTLPKDFLDVEAVPSFTSIIAHDVVYLAGETHALVQVRIPGRAGGVFWVYARSCCARDADDDGFAKLSKYLETAQKKTAVNDFFPIFTFCQVTRRGRGAGKIETAIVISHDAKSKFAYMVAYSTGGCQDVYKGQVTFAANTVSAITQNTLLNYIEPRSFKHAKSYPDFAEWEAATNDEINSLIEQKVLDPCDATDIPADKNVVDSKIVYKLKKNKDGSVDKYKARIVARGFTQVYGEDFDETYAPVTQLVTVRLVIILCMHFNIVPQHLDIKTAFLNAELKHIVYLKLPPGVTIGGKTHGRLMKSLYGLKQAGHNWHQLQDAFILDFDSRFRRSSVDPCLYVIVTPTLIVIISTHVDDYVAAANCQKWYAAFLAAFSARFNVTQLGVLDHLLQMSVAWNQTGPVILSQKRFILELAAKHGLDATCNPVQTPMEVNLKLEPTTDVEAALPYRSLVSSLLWLARNTRPDIMYPVIYLARFSNSYGAQHFKAAKRILRYVVSTVEKSLVFPRQKFAEKLRVVTFSDADWASDPNDRKSFSGSVVSINGCTVSWGCKKQVTIALSSVEAEYMALSDATRETLYVFNLLSEFFPVAIPVPIYVDNKGAGFIAENNINNKMTKHIDVRYHFVRYYITKKLIELFHVPTAENVADIFTKALPPEVFKKLSKMLLHCT